MKKIYQTKFGKPNGNCCGACVVSVLDIECDIPDFHGDNWWGDLQRFVRNYGYEAMYFCPDDREMFFNHIAGQCPTALYIACNYGPRRLKHCVVCRGKEMVHDPHPDGGGITMPPEDYIYFVKSDMEGGDNMGPEDEKKEGQEGQEGQQEGQESQGGAENTESPAEQQEGEGQSGQKGSGEGQPGT